MYLDGCRRSHADHEKHLLFVHLRSDCIRCSSSCKHVQCELRTKPGSIDFWRGRYIAKAQTPLVLDLLWIVVDLLYNKSTTIEQVQFELNSTQLN